MRKSDEWVHFFDEKEAVEHGVDCAIMIQHLRQWLRKNKANESNTFDGKTWTYNTKKGWAMLLPFYTEKQIRRILDKLIDKKIVVTGRYNKMKYDRTLWYTLEGFDTETVNASAQTGQCQRPEKANVNGPKGPTDTILSPSSLPTKKPGEAPARALTDKYQERFEKATGSKPIWEKKDFVQCARILKVLDPAVALVAVDAYFDKKWWFVNGGGRSFGQFSSRINDIVSAIGKPSGARSEEPIDCVRCGRPMLGHNPGGVCAYCLDHPKEAAVAVT